MKIDESKIKSVVCESFGVEESDFVIMGRSETYSHTRFAYYVLARKFTDLTLEKIGQKVLLNHSTVSRGIARHEDLLVTKRDYAFAFKKAEKELKDKTKLVFRDEGNSVLNTHQETERMVVVSIQDTTGREKSEYYDDNLD